MTMFHVYFVQDNKGRYISIISIQGKNRTVLIVPGISFYAGWWTWPPKLESSFMTKLIRQ